MVSSKTKLVEKQQKTVLNRKRYKIVENGIKQLKFVENNAWYKTVGNGMQEAA